MPPEGGVHGYPNEKCAKMCRRYVGSAIWSRSVKKKSGKNLQGKNYRGVATPPPLGRLRVKSVDWSNTIAKKHNVILNKTKLPTTTVKPNQLSFDQLSLSRFEDSYLLTE